MANAFDSASLIVTPNAYKASKLYALKPTNGTGDLDLVRATTATRVNSLGLIETVAANIPRLDYTNASCPSLLVEPQRTNLATRSEEFDNVIWVKISSTITANSTIAPNGTLTADTIFETTANDNHGMYQTAVLNNATSYTYSYFVKPNGRNWVSIRFLPINGVFVTSNVWFNISNGTIGTTDSGITATIQPSANGFYKITATRTTSAAGIGFVGLYLAESNNSQSYIGIATSGVFVWGAQLEAASFATSYIPTVAAAVTRNADVVNKTGISSLINSTEGVLFADLQFLTGIGTVRSINISNGSNNNRIGFYGHPSLADRITFAISSGGVTTDINFNGIILTNRNKVIIKYSGTTFTSFVNGVKSTNQTFTPFAANFLNRIGLDYGEDILRFEGRLNSLLLYKTALTDTECINLTTL